MEIHTGTAEKNIVAWGNDLESQERTSNPTLQKTKSACQLIVTLPSQKTSQIWTQRTQGQHHFAGLPSSIHPTRDIFLRWNHQNLGVLDWWFLEDSQRAYEYFIHNKDPVNYVTYDQQGRYLASSSSDLSIKLWDLNNDYLCFKTLFGHNHNVSQLAFNP